MTHLYMTSQHVAPGHNRLLPVSEPNPVRTVRHAMLQALTLIGLGLVGIA